MSSGGAQPLAGRVALVTGAASGQGRATAIRLARDGARVAAVDCDADGLASVAAEVRAGGRQCLPLTVDVSSADAVDEAFARSAEALGPAYVLAAAAAVYPPPQSLVGAPAALFEAVFAVNLFGVVHCLQAAAGQMLGTGAGGRIVLWSSAGARRAIAGHAAYCASKGAIEALARVAASELGPAGIRVNVIAPGAIDTPMVAHEDLAPGVAPQPVARAGRPEEVAELAAFLCSPLADYLTGSVVAIDGGLCAIDGIAAALGPSTFAGGWRR
jgi:NAD(P)-dependent dehydrogenase (short-subunit alcohol dehydrogenase family)